MINRALVSLLAIAGAAIVVPAAAEDSAPPAGRFQLTSGADSSFVRLDTRTGAVSHCRQSGGVWRCDPIMDSGLADRLTALSDKVDRLSTELDRLSLRVDGMGAGAGTRAPAAATTADDRAGARPTGFVRAAVYRLLDMIRTIKHGRADAT